MSRYKSILEIIAFYTILFFFICPSPLNAETLRISLPPEGEVSERVETVRKGAVVVRVVGALDLAQFRAWLNGREVTHVFDTVQQRREWHRKARLGASDGLVYGMNQLEVEVTSGTGDSIRDNRAFEVVDGRPIVGAGADRIVRLGHSARLDGSDSASTGPLDYHWELLQTPVSSQAQFLGSDTPTPLLVPDIPGTYEIGLKVSDGRHRSGSDTVTLHATDQPIAVSLNTVVCDDGQLGIQVGETCYLNTGAQNGLGIHTLVLDRTTLEKIDDTCPTLTGQRDSCSIATVEELADFWKIFRTLDRWQNLVILSRPLDAKRMTVDEATLFHDILIFLGVDSFTRADLEHDTMAISVLGVKGFSAGQGYVAQRRSNTGIEGNLMLNAQAEFWAFTWTDYRSFTVNIGKPGEIVLGDHPFPLGAWDGRGGGFHMLRLDPATLSGIDNDMYLINGPSAEAQQKLLCESLEEAMRFGYVIFIASFGAPFGGDSNNYDDLTCIVQSIQRLGGTAHVAAQLNSKTAYAFAARGVRPREAAFEASDLITLPGAPYPMKAQLTGVLGRNRHGWFEPVVADATGDLKFELFKIAYQSPVSWPKSTTTPGGQGALCYITQQLGIMGTQDVRSLYPDTQGFQPDVGRLNAIQFPSSTRQLEIGGTRDIRSLYPATQGFQPDVGRLKDVLFPAIAQQLGIGGTRDVRTLFPDIEGFPPAAGGLNDVLFPSNPTCGGNKFTKADFDAVKTQLVTEFSDLRTIRNFFKALKVPFKGSNTITEFVELNVIADKIISALKAAEGTDFLVDILDVVEGVLQMISAVIPIIGGQDGEDGGGGGAAVDVISSLITMAEGIAQLAGNGQPADRIRAKRDQLETALVQSTTANLATFDRFQEIIVSDWGKMRTVAGKASDPNEWLFSDPDLEQAIAAYDRGAVVHFWSALMGAIYQRFEILPGVLYDPVTHEAQFPGEDSVDAAWQVAACFFGMHPFGESRDTLGDQWLWSGFVEGGPRNNLLDYLNVWAVMPRGGPTDRWCIDTARVPSKELTEELRRSPEEKGPGLYMPWFWNEFEWYHLVSFWPHDVPQDWPDLEAEVP